MVNLRDSNGRSLYFSNRKEYYRRLHISQAWARKKFKRIRKQLAYNTEYSMSVRAIQINGTATEKQLKEKITEFLESNPQLLRMSWDTEGYEETEIDSEEDKNLKDGVIYVEVNLRGSVTFI